jgi:hypothetical protein
MRLPPFTAARRFPIALALALTAALPGGATSAPELPGPGTPIAALSGDYYRTVDLGPDPAQPDRRLYRAEIGGGSAARISGPEADGEFKLSTADGRWIAWRPELPAGESLAARPARRAETPGGDEFETLKSAAWRAGERGLEARVPAVRGAWRARVSLSPGLRLWHDARANTPGAEATVLDERGVTVATIRWAVQGASLAVHDRGIDGYDLALTPEKTRRAGNPGLTSVVIGLGGNFGGYQCNQGTGGVAFDSASPWLYSYAGEYTNVSYPRFTCDGYLYWSINGVVPAGAQVVGVNISPLNVNLFVGVPQTLHFVDVSSALPFGTTFNLATWTDMSTMAPPGRPEYGTAAVTATGNLAAPVTLGLSAQQDLQALLRPGTPFNFAVGFYAPPVAQNNYLTVTTNSTLNVTYSLPVNPGIVINRMKLDAPSSAGNAEAYLYNYGDDTNIGGWKIQSVNWLGTTETYTVPAGFTLPRHRGLHVIDGVGTSSGLTLYTGGGLFHWGKAASPYNVQVALLNSDAAGVDFTCWGGAVPALPVGAGWTGACPAAAPGEGGDVHRVRDADVDDLTDWAQGPVSGAPELLAGQYGTRRQGGVVISQMLVWGANYDWLELTNYGPAVDLNGWSLVLYDWAGVQKIYYFSGAAPLASGQQMWLAEGTSTTFYPGSGFGNADNLHRNMGITVAWGDAAPYGGEIVLRDAGLAARDYVAFGSSGQPHKPAYFPWIGTNIGTLASASLDLALVSDLTTGASAAWVERGYTGGEWGALNSSQFGATRRQDEAGGNGQLFQNSPAAGGSGTVVTVTRQVGIEEFSFEATPAAAPRNGLIVVKKQGSGTIYSSTPVFVPGGGTQVIRSGRINPPVILNPGTYAVMLYLDGAWQDNERFSSQERLSFGTVGGVAYEAGFAPTAPFAVNYPGYAMHSWMTVIDPPVINAAPAPAAGEVGRPYSFTHAASGGTGAPYSWSVVSGSLPAGISLTSGGQFTGTPTASGTYYLSVKAADPAGLASTLAEILTVNPALAITTATLPNATTLAFYSAALSTSGGVAPVAFSVISGALPAGVTLSAGGTFSGTPAASGTFNFSVQALDALGGVATAPLTLKVYTVTLLSASGPTSVTGEVGVALAMNFTASGGTAPYAWSIPTGGLPAGVTLNPATGSISGTPTANYNAFFIVRVSDASGQTFDLSTPGNPTVPNRRIVVNPRLKIADAALTPYDSGTVYNHTLHATGGSGPPNWVCTFPGAFGASLSCAYNAADSYWHVTGILAAGVGDGSYSVTLSATDGAGVNDTKSVPLQVYRSLQILNSALSGGTIGFDYGQEKLLGAGGSGAPQWSVSAGNFPPGLALAAATGLITGTPTQAGSFSFTVTFANFGGRVNRNFSIIIGDPAIPPYWVRRGLSGGSVGMTFSPSFALDHYQLGRNATTAYHSFDGGYFWQQINFPDAPNADGAFLAQDYLRTPAFAPNFDARPVGTPGRPADASQTFVMTRSYSGVWYTDDLGATWTQLNTGLGSNRGAPYIFANGFYFDPDYKNNRKVYVRSYNQTAKHYAYYSGVINTVAKTISWAQISQPGFPVNIVSMSPAFATDQSFYSYLPATGNTVVYRSSNAGATWSPLASIPAGFGNFFSFSPNFATDGTMAAVTYDSNTGLSDGMFVSRDSGATFTRQSAGRAFSQVSYPNDYNAVTNKTVYASEYLDSLYYTSSQMLISTDDGLNFVSVGKAGMTATQYGGYFVLSPDFANDGLIMATGTGSPGVFRSQDRGQTWSPSDGGLSNQPIVDIGYAPGSAQQLVIATSASVYSTINGGVSWRKAILPRAGSISAIEVSPSFNADRKVFAWQCAGASCFILRSTDGGVSFQDLSQTANTLERADSFRISPNFAVDHRLYYIGYDAILTGNNTVLYRSADEGLSFNPQGTVPIARFTLSPDFATDQMILASAGYDGVYTGPVSLISSDGGASFVPYTPLPSNNGFSTPAFSPAWKVDGQPGSAARTAFWNCWKTVDGGQTFGVYPATGSGCSPNDYLGFLSPSPSFGADNTLYSYVQSTYVLNGPSVGQVGLHRSSDGGNTFTRLTIPGDAYAFATINGIAPSPVYNADQTVFVATGQGLYKSTNGGANWSKSSGTEAFAPDVSAVALDLNRQGVVYVGTQSGRVFYSEDDGNSADEVTANLLGGKIQAMVTTGAPVTRLVVGTPAGIYHRTDFTANGFWTLAATGDFRAFTRDTTYLYAARADSVSLKSADGGVTWVVMAAALSDATSMNWNNQSGPTIAGLTASPKMPQGNTASLWSASAASGSFYSTNAGASWLAAPGAGDYLLPTGAGNYTATSALGINPTSNAREVLIGHNSLGVFLSKDGGLSWRNTSGAGSGLEATSKVVSALLATTNQYSATDVLVGVTGATTGGVYLSGDGGDHWTQLNQGFDPSSLNISTLAKSSCSGCPVQYYSGTYGSGVYTRTIAVTPAPAVTSWCFGSAGCACPGIPAAGSGPEQGGQGFKLCGGNFLALPVIEFDGVAASGCVLFNSSTITCTGTPPHVPGTAVVKVRNTDTRAGTMPMLYTYTGGAARASNLRVAKSGGNATLTWSCDHLVCTASAPARVYRSQNSAFTLNLETYNGGASNSLTDLGTMPNTGALAPAANPSYFWNVE